MRAAVDTTVVCGDAEPADYAPTPKDLLASLRQRRSVVASGEADILAIAVEWAHTHPELDLEGNQLWWRPGKRGQAYAEKLKTAMHEDGSPVAAGKAVELEDIEWFAIPMIAWDAAAPFAAANGMPTASGKALIRDALILHHRLPLIYQQVKTGLMPAWKARQVAQACIGKPDDVVSDLDERFADLAGTHGLVTVQRMLAEAMLRLYPDQAEVERLEKLDRRRVELNELDDTPTTGLAELVACGDWLDLQDFEATVAAVAEALKHTDDAGSESLDVRRALAIGILADPASAAEFLAGSNDPSGESSDLDTPSTVSDSHTAPKSRPRRRRAIEMVIHLGPRALSGGCPTAFDDTGRVWFCDTIADWASEPGTRVTVRPIIDPYAACGDEHDPNQPDPYSPAEALKRLVRYRDRCCVFPHCNRPASACDLDHTEPHGDGGATCICNLAPLCRAHHQMKTHSHWTYWHLQPGTFVWLDTRHQQAFLRTPTGTADLTPARSP